MNRIKFNTENSNYELWKLKNDLVENKSANKQLLI